MSYLSWTKQLEQSFLHYLVRSYSKVWLFILFFNIFFAVYGVPFSISNITLVSGTPSFFARAYTSLPWNDSFRYRYKFQSVLTNNGDIINWSKTGVWPISMSVDAMVISFRDTLGNIIGSFSRHTFLLITAKFATGRWTALVFFFTATLIPVRFTMSGWLFGPSRYTYIMRKIHRFHIVHWNSLPWTQTTLTPYEIY